MNRLRLYDVGVSQEGNVLIDLRDRVRYVVLAPEDARRLAAYLVKHANAADLARLSPAGKPS